MFDSSDAYERFMGRWSRKLAPQLVDFAGVRDGDRVLEVGCGTGALTAAIADAAPGADVVAIDPSAAFVETARAHLPSERVRFEVGLAEQLAFVAGAFDRVLSMLVFNFLPEPLACLAEQRRVTRPGGTISAAVWDYGAGMEMLSAFWEEAGPGAAERHERNMPLCRLGDLESLWRAGGLADVEERPLTIELAFADFDDFWSPFLGGVGPAGAFVRALDDAGRAGVRERLRTRLLGAGGVDRAFTLGARAWAVRGTVPR
jgi:SAM-dependent methyltransferase